MLDLRTARDDDEMAEDAAIIFSRVLSSLPVPIIRHLLSSGVCVRCIFRLFGIRGDAYSCPLLTGSRLHYFLNVQSDCCGGTSENGLSSFGLTQCSYTSEESDVDRNYCTICLGILQFPHELCLKGRIFEESSSIDIFVDKITEFIKKENYQLDGFFLEVSIPTVIVANERSIWLHMKKNYDGEAWLKDKVLCEQISLKDALKLSITPSLEKKLRVKSGANSFHIRLTYTHSEASLALRNALREAHSSKRRRTERENMENFSGNGQLDSSVQLCSISDAVTLKELNGLEDDIFCKRFELPPKEVSQSCQLVTTCYRVPMFIGGRYLKLSRKVSQTRWIIDDERMGEASVEEIIGNPALEICRGDSYKFHAAGREDIDVRMLGSGRPFLIEVSNARCSPSMVDVLQITARVNSSAEKYVMVKNLRVVGSEAWNLMREGEAEKQKQYTALAWISRPLMDEDLHIISSAKDLEISQGTPIRVLHRRSPLERKRVIHWMKIEKIVGSDQFFLLHLCTQAGTYIKEFVHGDLGRTSPSIGSLLACRAEILQLDVTDVKMDAFI